MEREGDVVVRTWRAVIIALVVSALLWSGRAGIMPDRASATGSAAPARLGQIRYIKGGVSVTPPHRKGEKGKKKKPVYTLYGLRTKTKQLVSVWFTDKTVLHMNQQTTLVLKNPHLTT